MILTCSPIAFSLAGISPAIQVIDLVLFVYFAWCGLYILLFALASVRKMKTKYPPKGKKHRFAVFFPAYNEEQVIIGSVKSFLEQDYPRELYTLFVISDHMKEEVNLQLEALSVRVLRFTGEHSSKANALKFAIHVIEKEGLHFDAALVMDADNRFMTEGLSRLNDAFNRGWHVIQTHRVARSRNTNVAILDSLSEEINNSIFRKGHVRLGISASIIGSGIAYEYPLFVDGSLQCDNAGEDKQMELFLFRNNVKVYYLNDVLTYDEKVKQSYQFLRQRNRWFSAQFYNLFQEIKHLPLGFSHIHVDYWDKLAQWLILPRVIMMGSLFLIALIETFCLPQGFVKWWILFGTCLFSLMIATPRYLYNRQLCKAVMRLPYFFVLSVFNLFHLTNPGKHFIHVEHTEE